MSAAATEAQVVTTTARQAPTEAEIRAALERAWEENRPSDRPSQLGRSGVVHWEDAWNEVSLTVDAFWNIHDLRESEMGRLNELLHDATAPLREEIRPRLIDALVNAAVTFAAEHPYAPRCQEGER